MLGRFALYSDYPKLSASLKLSLAEPDQPLTRRYNVPPGTFISAGCAAPMTTRHW